MLIMLLFVKKEKLEKLRKMNLGLISTTSTIIITKYYNIGSFFVKSRQKNAMVKIPNLYNSS